MQKDRFLELLNGIDVSKYQGKIDWAVLRNPAGFPENLFCVIKAGGAYSFQGTYVDPKFEENSAAAPVHFDYVGAYYFFIPRGGVEFARKQARLFWEIVKDKEWNFLCVDVESQPWGFNVSPAEFQACLKAFLEEIELLSNGVKCWIYTRASFWSYHVGSPDWAIYYPLWVARYHDTLESPWGDGRFKAFPWATMAANDEWENVTWQHSADGNNLGNLFGVESRDIDRNAFNGTAADFERMLKKYGRFDDPITPPVGECNCESEIADILSRLTAQDEEIKKLQEAIGSHTHEEPEGGVITAIVTDDKTLAKFSSGYNEAGKPKIANNIYEPRLKWEQGQKVLLQGTYKTVADGGTEWYILEPGQGSVLGYTVPASPVLYVNAADLFI